VYHQDGMSVEEYDEYTNVSGYNYKFIPVRTIDQALDDIIDGIIAAEDRLDSTNDPDNPKEDLMVVCCFPRQWNAQAVKYINNVLTHKAETQILDIYKHFKITNDSQLEQIVKNRLNTEFVYRDDPIAYGFALYKALGGDVM